MRGSGGDPGRSDSGAVEGDGWVFCDMHGAWRALCVPKRRMPSAGKGCGQATNVNNQLWKCLSACIAAVVWFSVCQSFALRLYLALIVDSRNFGPVLTVLSHH